MTELAGRTCAPAALFSICSCSCPHIRRGFVQHALKYTPTFTRLDVQHHLRIPTARQWATSRRSNMTQRRHFHHALAVPGAEIRGSHLDADLLRRVPISWSAYRNGPVGIPSMPIWHTHHRKWFSDTSVEANAVMQLLHGTPLHTRCSMVSKIHKHSILPSTFDQLSAGSQNGRRALRMRGAYKSTPCANMQHQH